LADAITHDGLAQAMLVAARDGGSFVRALVATGAVDRARLAQYLERGDAPYMHQVVPVVDLVEALPAGLCDRLLALPVRRDPLTGTIDVAVVDSRDPHPVHEIAYWLNAPVRLVQTSLGAMEAALLRLSAKPERGVVPLAAPIWQASPPEADPQTPRYGRALLPSEGQDPVAIIELGPPAIERMPVPGADSVAPRTVPGPYAGSAEDDDASAGPTMRGPYAAAPAQPSAEEEIVAFSADEEVAIAEDDPEVPGATAIRRASDRDDILDALIAGVRQVARRVGVFALRRDGIVGWACSPELADAGAFRSLRWPPAAHTVLRAALASRGVSFVPVPADAVDAPLAVLVGPPTPHEVALAGVRVDGKAVAVVLATDLSDALAATERLQALAGVAGESLETLLRERRERRESDA
jgi:hypothetical protein